MLTEQTPLIKGNTSNSGLRSPLAHDLVQADSGGYRDIQAGYGTAHRQAGQHIAPAGDVLPKAGVLPAHDQCHRACKIAFVKAFVTGVAGSYDGHPILADPVQRLACVGNDGERDAFGGTGRDLADGGSQPRRSVPGYDDCVDTGSISRAQARTKVVRVLNAVKDKQEQRLFFRQPRLDEGPEGALIERLASSNLGDHALVAILPADLVKTCPIGGLDFDTLGIRPGYHRFKSRIRGLVFRIQLQNIASSPIDKLLDGAQTGHIPGFAHFRRFLPGLADRAPRG